MERDPSQINKRHSYVQYRILTLKTLHTYFGAERSQLGARTHMGLLEKKKDYKIRSADYHRKENAIKALKVKAEFRNPDEFYHKMISSSTKKGVHEVKQRVEKYDGDALKLLKSADLRYVLY